MITKSFIKCGCLFAVAAAALLATSTQADTPAFVLGSVSTNQPSSFIGTRGWQFGRAGTPNDILITQLGVFDNDGDGLVNSHQIGLWRDIDNLSGTLLASATVPAGTAAPLVEGYRWVSISPVRIPYALAFYVVAAQYLAGDADDLVTPMPSTYGQSGGFRFAPEISVFTGGGRGALGSDLPYPAGVTAGPCEGCSGERFWEPNLQYTVVPEPSVWLLLSSALFCLLLRYRRNR